MGCVIPLIFFRSEHSRSREEGRKEKTFCDGAKQGSALERGGTEAPCLHAALFPGGDWNPDN